MEPVTISDNQSGSRAKILPGLGFNCYSFEAGTPNGPLEVLWSLPDFADGKTKPSRSGIPLLFPFAGRIRGTSYRFEGREYALEPSDDFGNAIHGFVINRPWRVTHQSGGRVTGTFQASVDDPSLLRRWPADFRITADYQLAGNNLISDFVIGNPDDKPLPFGFGTHGYFRVPLGGSRANDCRVTVPVGNNWELVAMLPTGQTTSPPVVGQLAAGMPFSEMKLDHVLAGLKFDNHRLAATLDDPHSGRRLTLTFDDQFAACVVFNPPHREAVCIEPYTTIPNAFELREKNIDPYMRILAPGQAFRTRIEMKVT